MSNARLSRRAFLRSAGLGVAGLAVASASCAQDAAPRKPNIIIFFTDDHGWGDVGCYGCKDIATPNIDALAASGMRLTSHYAPHAICSPSRAGLLTGLIPRRAGVPTNVKAGWDSPGLRPDRLTIAEMLKKIGYATACFGKWHLGTAKESRPNSKGFDQFFGHTHGCIGYYDHIFKWSGPLVHDLWRDDKEVHEDGQYFTELITREALRFLGESRNRPFFMYVAYNAPHYPMEAPQAWLDKYADLETNRRPYAALVSCLDDSVGQIVGRVRELGLLGNTLFIFASDNGPSDEERTKLDKAGPRPGSAGPFRGSKFSFLEGGIRVPFIASWPGHIPAGAVSDELSIHLDILPTVAEAVGVKPPDGLDGKSMWPILQGGKTAHEALFWDPRPVIRRGQWKLHLPVKNEAPQLYDLGSDPGENKDLAQDQPDLVKELREAYEAWRKDEEERERQYSGHE